MNQKKYNVRIFLIVLLTYTATNAQDVFTFVAGEKAPAIQTGDYLHQYDYWIKPLSTANLATLQIFDAGTGGIADVIIGPADTKTIFQLFPIDSIDTGNPTYTIVTSNEQKYINRWINITTINADASPNGWILRVIAKGGDDVNAFKINITDDKGTNQIGKNWMLYSYELPICLFGLSENEEVQICPHPSFATRRIEIQAFGEELSTIIARDIFGEISNLPINPNFMKKSLAGIQNKWGVSISGSAARINNLVIRSKSDSAIVWEWLPTIVQKPKMPAITIKQQPVKDCNSMQLTLTGITKKEDYKSSPIWSIGDNSFIGDSIIFEFPKAGTYLATVLIPTTGFLLPKYWTQNFKVNINAPPIATITSKENIISPGQTLVLSSNESIDPEGNPLSFQWYINNEYRSNKEVLYFNSLIPGKYKIKLVVNDGATNSLCNESVAEKIIRVNSQPYAEINAPRIIGRGIETKFIVKNDFDSDGDELSFTWNGEGIIGPNNQRSATIKHNKAGFYDITLTVSDNTNTANAIYTTKINYRVNADPIPAFTLPEKAAPQDEIHLNATNTMDPDNKNLLFRWFISDGTELDGQEVKHSFELPGTYTITLKVDDGEGVENSLQTYSRTIKINAPPVPIINAVDHSTSARQTFSAESSYDDDGDELKFYWNFGDGNIATGEKVTHVFQKSGRYEITLMVDDGQKQSNSQQITSHILVINKYPIAQFSAPKKWEPNLPLTIDGTKSYDPDGEISKYYWYINGKEVATNPIANFTFPEPGDYAIALKVKDNSGFDDAIGIQTASIHINHPPIIKWKTIPEVAEENELITFDATGTYDPDGKIKTIKWEFPDNTTLIGTQVKKTFNKPGLINIRITADDGDNFSNSIQSKNFNFLVNNKPIIVTKTFIRSNSQVILLDASQSYDIDGHTLKFKWILPDGTNRYESSFNWKAPKPGVHFITLSVDDGQGKKNSIVYEKIKLIINSPPIAVVDSIIHSCTGSTVLLNSSLSYDPDGDPITVLWDFGDGTSSTETNPVHIYTKPGYYLAKLTLNDGFAEQPTIATVPIIIEGSPQAIQNFKDTTICVNTSLIFDGTQSTDPNGPIGSFSWDFGDGINAFGSIVTHAYAKPGTYYTTLTVIGNGSGRCSRVSQSISTVNVVEGPVADFSIPDAISLNEEINLDASASRVTDQISMCSWEIFNNNKIISKEGIQTKLKFDTPGSYTVKLTIKTQSTTNCNSSTKVKTILVNAPPILIWDIPKSIAQGDKLLLDASKCYDPDGIITEYSWTVDGIKIGNTPIISIPIQTAGEHKVTLKVTDNSGTSTNSISESKVIYVNSKPDPLFVTPDTIYESELITLEPKHIIDADKDTLEFIWKVDGIIKESNKFNFTAGKHIITLIANDKRGLRNSIDSIQKEISVISKPDLKTINIPKNWSVGSIINISKITNIPNLYFITDLSKDKTLVTQATGEQIIKIGWAPRNIVLAQENFTINVLSSLEFISKPAERTIQWNPSNPFIVLEAPEVNRPETMKVNYEWKKGNVTIGFGKIISAPLSKGKNIFTLYATDQDVEYSKPIFTEIVVNCE